MLQYIVEHCEGNCLNVEQMTVSLLESELLFLNCEAGAYELEGDIASTPLPVQPNTLSRLGLCAAHS